MSFSAISSNLTIRAYTSFPREVLSYRWIISDVNIVLKNLTQGLKSPLFSVYLPLKPNSDKQGIPFHLWLQKKRPGDYSVSLCLNGTQIARSTERSLTADSTAMMYYFTGLPTILISDVVFSILFPKSNLMRSVKALNKECYADYRLGPPDNHKDSCSASFKLNEDPSYDTLTIEVEAVVLCTSNPTEVQKEACLTSVRKLNLDEKLFADVTIKCGDEEFKVHKAILASQSSVFKKMFQTNMKEKSSNVLEISDMEPAVVSDLLEFMYTGKATNITKLAKDLLYAANKYELQQLIKLCENELILTLTVDNVAERILLADKHQNVPKLFQTCLKIIKNHPSDVYKTEGWKKFIASDYFDDLLPKVLKGPSTSPGDVASNPIRGCSSFPKVQLSYSWVISDAKVVLKDLTQGLRSPVIPVYLNLEHKKKCLKFYLQIDGSVQGNSLFLCYGERPNTYRSKHSSHTTNSSQQILISNVSSILVPSMNKVTKVPDRQFGADDYVGDFGVIPFIKHDEMNSYIPHDTLTIQVDATILCISNPVETQIPTDSYNYHTWLLHDESFADYTIKCGDEEFKVHKAILASQSPVFKAMFMKKKNSNVLEISDTEPAVVSDLLEFMYTGKATNITKLAKDLLYAANKYQLPLLLKMCENELMMTLTADNVAEIILLADRHQATELKQLCLEVIKSQPTKVYKTEGWKTFMASNCTSDLLYEILEDEQNDLSSDIVPAKKPRYNFD